MADDLETAIRAGAIAALRRRAERQRQRASEWTVDGENGVRVVAGEGRIAERIAAALYEAADAIAGECGS
jgi:hypothetical protein